jgi:hypothetical protein
MTAKNRSDAEPSLESLIERSAELKRALVDFACSPKLERHLTRFVQRSVSPGEVLDEGEAADLVDRFALQHRLPSGKTVLEQFLSSRPDLSKPDREMVRGWGDPVEAFFENRGKDGTATVLLNLLDDLEYRTYSNMGPAAFHQLPKGGFACARLVPIGPVPGAWLVSGYMAVFPKSGAAEIAQVALELATRQPELVFRNPEKVEQGWTQMRADRAAFIEFFGGDELVLATAEAQERLNAYYQHRRQAVLAEHPDRRKSRQIAHAGGSALEIPSDLSDGDTVGIIYDEVDGLNFYNDYGMLRELFADPSLAASKRYAEVLRSYLQSDSVGPLPIRRLALAYPETVDAVFRKVVRKPSFTWAEHGEALLRRRKARYYEREPRPGLTVISARLEELLDLG